MNLAGDSGPLGFGRRATTIPGDPNRIDPDNAPTQQPRRVMIMPHQKPRAPKASCWRDVRAKAIEEGRLNETALETHKHRMRALDGERESDGPE